MPVLVLLGLRDRREGSRPAGDSGLGAGGGLTTDRAGVAAVSALEPSPKASTVTSLRCVSGEGSAGGRTGGSKDLAGDIIEGDGATAEVPACIGFENDTGRGETEGSILSIMPLPVLAALTRGLQLSHRNRVGRRGGGARERHWERGRANAVYASASTTRSS